MVVSRATKELLDSRFTIADLRFTIIMESNFNIGIIGSGSWATALVKILTDNHHKVNWWTRNAASIEQIKGRRHNPNYLPSAYFDVSLLNLYNDVREVA